MRALLRNAVLAVTALIVLGSVTSDARAWPPRRVVTRYYYAPVATYYAPVAVAPAPVVVAPAPPPVTSYYYAPVAAPAYYPAPVMTYRPAVVVPAPVIVRQRTVFRY
jgi:hypothetical protein